MGSKTRIIILRMKTLIFAFILCLILILITLVTFLILQNKKNASPTYSPEVYTTSMNHDISSKEHDNIYSLK